MVEKKIQRLSPLPTTRTSRRQSAAARRPVTQPRIYNVVDDEAPDQASPFAASGESLPDGSNAEQARAFDVLMDGQRIREDLGDLESERAGLLPALRENLRFSAEGYTRSSTT